jgi:hypothetical protein
MKDIKIEVKCDFQTSEFCKKEYLRSKYAILLNRKKNGDKYRCKYCAIQDTHFGEKSHYFKNKLIYHDFFINIDSEIKAYLLGIIAGDGSIYRKQVSLVAADKDIETIELFKKYICPEASISFHGNCKVINIISRDLVRDLCKHLKINYGKKSDKISLPDLNEDLMPHFIRGLVDTDGCIDNPYTTKKNTVRCFYSSTSKLILTQIKNKFNDLNINSCLNGIKLTFCGKFGLSFLNYIYKDATFALSRKKAFYDIWKTWKPKMGTCIRPSKMAIKIILKQFLD